MYNKSLNVLFEFFSRLDKAKAIKMSDNYLSPDGVKRSLLCKLRQNELFRYQIFRGKYREDMANDKLLAAEERVLSNYKAGLM